MPLEPIPVGRRATYHAPCATLRGRALLEAFLGNRKPPRPPRAPRDFSISAGWLEFQPPLRNASRHVFYPSPLNKIKIPWRNLALLASWRLSSVSARIDHS